MARHLSSGSESAILIHIHWRPAPGVNMLEEWANVLPNDPMRAYRAKRDSARKSVHEKYTIKGFISSGTYGRVYKAQSTSGDSRFYAIKKFKPDKEGEASYTGLSQSAIREIAVSGRLSSQPDNR